MLLHPLLLLLLLLPLPLLLLPLLLLLLNSLYNLVGPQKKHAWAVGRACAICVWEVKCCCSRRCCC